MNLFTLIRKEISFKKLAFAGGVLSLVAATAAFVAVFTLMSGHDVITERLLAEKEKELRTEMAGLEDDYRRIMRAMGYNVLILSGRQSIPEMRKRGYPTEYMDYEDVWKLAHGDIHTLNHLLPVLQERIYWDEAEMEIMISGIRGQVPVFTKPEFLTDEGLYRSPITPRVPDGKADIGHTVATSVNLRQGDTISIRGKDFGINRIYPRRGTDDDLTVWIPLDAAQKILGKEGRINGIFALECVCELDELGRIREEVQAILPHAQVFEFSSLITARSRVRQRAAEAHTKVTRSLMLHRERAREETERFASAVVPILILGAALWIFVLIFNNVKERRAEIGVMRAVGFTRNRILKLFLFKAVFMGATAGAAGCIAGIAIGIRLSGLGFSLDVLKELADFTIIASGLIVSPVLSAAAGFIPSVIAANQDPAKILREE